MIDSNQLRYLDALQVVTLPENMYFSIFFVIVFQQNSTENFFWTIGQLKGLILHRFN